jgi:small subunit ribosomal protein S4
MVVNKNMNKDKNMNNKNQAEQNVASAATAKKRFKKVSEYGRQLDEKQKVKRMYGMREKQFRRFFKIASATEGAPGANLLNLLERRLDNTLYRLKIATSRSQARQMIVHGHVIVNGGKVTCPSFLVNIGHVITLSDIAKTKAIFIEQAVDKRMNLSIRVPEWLELIKQDRAGRVLRYPSRSDLQVQIEEHLIVELYSK